MKDKLFKASKLLASPQKSEGYTYLPREEAIELPFVQFNKHAVTSIIIDIDYVTQDELQQRLQGLPIPSIIVKTQKGFHVHYVLKYPVGYKKHNLVSWARRIKTAMLKKVGGDLNANGVSARIYRNPWKHESVFSNQEYLLKDLAACLDLTQPRARQESKGTFKKDFSKVKVGERHNKMFDYLRFNAYRLKHREDLQTILEYLATEANNEMQEPLPQHQIDSLINNICGFMVRYVGRDKSEVIAYNQALAKAKHDSTMNKILDKVSEVSFKTVSAWSARKLAKFVGVSNSTISKHLTKIINILRDKVLLNIQMSLVAFVSLLLPTYSYSVLINGYKTNNLILKDSS